MKYVILGVALGCSLLAAICFVIALKSPIYVIGGLLGLFLTYVLVEHVERKYRKD